jgi:hypothetical protein
MINQANPSSPTFDPLGTHELRQRIEDNKRQSGDILAQAEQQVLADEQRKQQEEAYLNSPEGKIAKAKQEIQDMKAWLLNDQRYTPEEVDSITNKLTVEYDSELDKAIVLGDIILGSLKSAEGLQLPETVGGSLVLDSLTSAEGLQLPETVGESLWLDSLTSAKGLQLPETVGGDLWLGGLTSTEGLQLPETVGGSLGLFSLTSAKGLQLPETVGRNLFLFGLTSPKGLQLPQSVGGNLELKSLYESDKQKLKELRPDLADKI